MANQQTGGNIIIQKSVNGYVVILPAKEQSTLGNVFGEGVKELRKAMGKGDLEEIMREKEPTPADNVFEMETFENVFVFRNFEAVLSFLKGMFSQNTNTDNQ